MRIADMIGYGPSQRGRPGLLRGLGRVSGAIAAGCWAWLRQAAERSSQRRALARLDDRLLRDVGLSRDDAEVEARKPFWLD